MSVIEKKGKHYKYSGLYFFAHQGMVHVRDEPHGEHYDVTPLEFSERAERLGEAIDLMPHPELRVEATNAVNNMEACAFEAASQGDPTKIENQLYWARHRTFATAYALVGGAPGRRR